MTIIRKKFLHCWVGSRPHIRFPNLGIQQRDLESPRILTLKDSGIWLQNLHSTEGNRLFEGINKILYTSRPRKRRIYLTEDWAQPAWVFESLWQRRGLAVACYMDRDNGRNSPGRNLLRSVPLKVTSSPTIEPVEARTGLPQAKQLTGKEHSPAHQQKIGLKIYWAWPFPPEQTQFSQQPVLPIRKLTQVSYLHPSEGRQKKQELNLIASRAKTRIVEN